MLAKAHIWYPCFKHSLPPQVHIYLNQHKTSYSLSKAIMAVPYVPGQTNMAEALKRMRIEVFQRLRGDRPGVPNIAVLLTDGYSSVEPDRTEPEANKSRAENGVLFFSIGGWCGINYSWVGVTKQIYSIPLFPSFQNL